MQQPTNLKTPEEAAVILNVAVGTLAYWRHVGDGPKWFKMGRRVKYDVDALNAYIDECKGIAR